MIDTKLLRQKLIDMALRGQLVEQRPEDGNAIDLLEQIRAEKSALIKAGKIKKEKPLPEIKEEEKPFAIPANWCWVRLGEIGYTNIGLTYSPNDIAKDGTIVLRSGNIQNGKIDYTDVVRVDVNIPDTKVCRIGDILICARNGSKRLVGKTALIDKEGLSFGAFMAIFRSRYNSYVINLLRSSYFRYSVLGGTSTSTTTVNQLTQDMIKNVLVPLPPLAEQKRIVAALESCLQLVDTIAKDSADLDKALKFLRQKVLDMAVRGQLVEQRPEDGNATDLLEQIRAEKAALIKAGKIKKEKPLPEIKEEEKPFAIPANWCWVRLNDIYNFIDYRGKTPVKTLSGVPLITAKNVRKGYIKRESAEFISIEEYEERKSRGVSHLGDILFTTEAPLGNVAIADIKQFSAGQRLITFQQYGNNESLENVLMMYFILSPYFQSLLARQSTGTTVLGIKAEKLKKLLIPLPPLAEQKRIVAKLEQINALIETALN